MDYDWAGYFAYLQKEINKQGPSLGVGESALKLSVLQAISPIIENIITAIDNNDLEVARNEALAMLAFVPNYHGKFGMDAACFRGFEMHNGGFLDELES